MVARNEDGNIFSKISVISSVHVITTKIRKSQRL